MRGGGSGPPIGHHQWTPRDRPMCEAAGHFAESGSDASKGYSAIGTRSRIFRPRTLFRHVRRYPTFFPASPQTSDKSALSLKRYRSASQLERKVAESHSSMVLAITPRHRKFSAVNSCSVANAFSLSMSNALSVCGSWVAARQTTLLRVHRERQMPEWLRMFGWRVKVLVAGELTRREDTYSAMVCFPG